uniref:Uncharacterized protein n=1 Tax=Anguilla anguilla TaxID=7936 RepID=A0A0E9SWH9_ANGAN
MSVFPNLGGHTCDQGFDTSPIDDAASTGVASLLAANPRWSGEVEIPCAGCARRGRP